MNAGLTAAESFLVLLDDLDADGAKPSGSTAKVLLAHAAGHIRSLLAELEAGRQVRAELDAEREQRDLAEARRDVAATYVRAPEWQCVVCQNRYPGRRPEDGICLVCADQAVHPLIGTTVVPAESNDPDPMTGTVVAVYPDDESADVRWGSDEGDELAATIRYPLSELRPFRARHLSAVNEAEGGSL